MGTDAETDKPADAEKPRHVWGPRPVGNLVAGLTRPAFRRRSPAAAQIMADWGTIVGPALAAITAPRRMTGATLTLACAGPVAMELQHMSGELTSRINAHLGRVAVERLRFVQEMLPPAAVVPVRPVMSGPPAPIQGFAPGELHDALARLGQAVRQTGRR
ncbi:DUF721 domain-containing protein [Acidisphaera sp. L21]|uniref:DUF721 domain-containing protein n=1 Tax=Acidisphaera sp. L21 TaxID=1641851 RepID=UPI00131CCEC3|nr:DciA family protein [Acidisphaera sp. L21]